MEEWKIQCTSNSIHIDEEVGMIVSKFPSKVTCTSDLVDIWSSKILGHKFAFYFVMQQTALHWPINVSNWIALHAGNNNKMRVPDSFFLGGIEAGLYYFIHSIPTFAYQTNAFKCRNVLWIASTFSSIKETGRWLKSQKLSRNFRSTSHDVWIT